MSSQPAEPPAVGFIGLGDQGLPIAAAIADAGYPLHVWDRRAEAGAALGGRGVRHGGAGELAEACQIILFCVSTDEDVRQIVSEQLLDRLAPGSVLVNHGTGTPNAARALAELGAGRRIHVLDAPVSGGRPAAQAHALTVFVGGEPEVLHRCEPLLRSYARHVVHLGPAGAGQMTKLFNNALLIANQAAIADTLELATAVGLDPSSLVEALKLGSAASSALTLLNTMVTPATVGHLSAVQELDTEIFDAAMREAGVDASEMTQRGLSGSRRLTGVIEMLNPEPPAA